MSKSFLSEHQLCMGYNEAGQHTASCDGLARHTDHLVAVTGPSDPLFWLESNWMARSAACHSVKTAIEDGGFGSRS